MIGSVDYHWLMRQAIGIACQAKVIGEPPFAALVAHIESGEIHEFTNEEIENIQRKIAETLGYKLVDHRLELYGIPVKEKK